LKALTNISLTSSKKDDKASSMSIKKKTRIHRIYPNFIFLGKDIESTGVFNSLPNPNSNLHNVCQYLKVAKTVIGNLRDSYENILLECKDCSSRWGISLNFHAKRNMFAIKYFDENDRRLNVTN